MNIKIEPGAKVQITDKPIINVFGDVVQHKEEHIHFDAKPNSSSEVQEAEIIEEEEKKPKATGGGRPKKSGTRISKAFIYNNKVDGSVRLRMLCQGLLALGWLAAETDVQVFVDLFSGGETRQRLIWKGDANTLAALFKRLVNERGLVTLPDKHSLWVMVSGHFWDKKRGQEFESDKLRNTHAPKENDQTIAYLVSILDPEVSMDEVREMIQNQR